MNYRQPTREQEDSYLKQVGYSRDQLEADVRILREWFDGQLHFPPSSRKEDDDFLKKFLVGCKGSLEKSKRKLDNYYSYRSLNSQIYDQFDPTLKEMAEAMDCVESGVLDEPLSDGTRVLCFRVKRVLRAGQMPTLNTLSIMILELELRKKGIWPMSYCFICDFEHVSLEEFVKTNPLLIKDFFYVVQEVMPLRIKKNILINVQSAIAGAVNYLFKPVCPKKISERFHVSASGWESIPEDIPKSILPKERGGNAPSLEVLSDDIYKNLRAKRDWFVGALSETTDESKRPPESKRNVNSEFGLDGSFKTLRVD